MILLIEPIRHASRCWPVALLIVFCVARSEKAWGRIDEKAKGQQGLRGEPLLQDDRIRAVSAATAVSILNQPFTAFAMLEAGMGFSLWSGLPEIPDSEISKAPPLSNLESVKDSTPIRSGEEGLAYCEALVKAHQTSEQVFQQSVTRGLTYPNLYHEPELHRGKVVHFEGRLRRLIRLEPPAETKLDGLKDQFEGWMFDPERYGANPVCVIFTDLPDGLEPGDKLDVRVSFDGYFFKKYRYPAADGLRDAPLLIGHTIILKQGSLKTDSEEGGLFSGMMAITFLAVLGGVFFLAFLVTLWYRRSDRLVQSRLLNAQTSTFVPPPAEGIVPENPLEPVSNRDEPQISDI
jgi:hypothetical protein